MFSFTSKYAIDIDATERNEPSIKRDFMSFRKKNKRRIHQPKINWNYNMKIHEYTTTQNYTAPENHPALISDYSFETKEHSEIEEHSEVVENHNIKPEERVENDNTPGSIKFDITFDQLLKERKAWNCEPALYSFKFNRNSSERTIIKIVEYCRGLSETFFVTKYNKLENENFELEITTQHLEEFVDNILQRIEIIFKLNVVGITKTIITKPQYFSIRFADLKFSKLIRDLNLTIEDVNMKTDRSENVLFQQVRSMRKVVQIKLSRFKFCDKVINFDIDEIKGKEEIMWLVLYFSCPIDLSFAEDEFSKYIENMKFGDPEFDVYDLKIK